MRRQDLSIPFHSGVRPSKGDIYWRLFCPNRFFMDLIRNKIGASGFFTLFAIANWENRS